MNCPSCDKKPVGIIHSFKKGGVSMEESAQGYFRCQHCDTLLKKKLVFNIIAKVELPFFFFIPALIASAALFPEFGLFLIEAVNPSIAVDLLENIHMALVIISVLIAIPLLLELITRYTIFEPAEESEITVTKQLPQSGKGIFLTFIIIALTTTVSIAYFVDFSVYNGWFLLGGFVAYLLTMVTTGSWILTRYSETVKNE